MKCVNFSLDEESITKLSELSCILVDTGGSMGPCGKSRAVRLAIKYYYQKVIQDK